MALPLLDQNIQQILARLANTETRLSNADENITTIYKMIVGLQTQFNQKGDQIVQTVNKELEQQKSSILELKSDLDNLRKEINDSIFWTPVNHVLLGEYNYQTGTEQAYTLPEAYVPASASQVLIAVNWSTGTEGSQRWVDTEVSTKRKSGIKYSMYTSGYRYPQIANSYDTQCFWFPIKDTNRTLYVYSKDCFPNGHGMRLHILGYK